MMRWTALALWGFEFTFQGSLTSIFLARPYKFSSDVEFLHGEKTRSAPALEATQGQMDGFFSQLLYKCHLQESASVGDRLKICPHIDSRVVPLQPPPPLSTPHDEKLQHSSCAPGRSSKASPATLEVTQGQTSSSHSNATSGRQHLNGS
jgi:hypothetical protein